MATVYTAGAANANLLSPEISKPGCDSDPRGKRRPWGNVVAIGIQCAAPVEEVSKFTCNRTFSETE